jgi:predicted transcriptional regulator
MQDIIKKQNEVIISLLGRIAFPEEKLKEIITKKKRDPDAYIRGYNSCNGKNTVTEIATVVGVNQSTLTPILQDWENLGIVYELDSVRGKTYLALYKINTPKLKQKLNIQIEKEVIEENGEESTG